MMKKYIGLIAMSLVLILVTGCPQNTQTVKPLPKPAAIPQEKTPQIAPTQEDKPETTEIVRPPEPAEINEPNITQPEKTPKKQPQQKIQKTVDVFHKKCASIFNHYVNNEGRVNYQQLRRNRLELIDLLKSFKKLDPKEYVAWPKEEKIAFWINTYNIALLKIIVENYPIESYRFLHVLPSWGPNSVRHINKRIGGIKNQKLLVMDEEFTLDEIEKRFFRKDFDDPRIFFAISFYSTVGGPLLRNEPYTGQKLNKQLDEQVKKFLSSQHGFQIDREQKTVYISPLFDEKQFGREFMRKYETEKKFKDHPPVTRAILNFCINYFSQNQINYLETQRYKVKFLIYDWNLNEQ